jgi:hypothetical protein
VITSGGGATLGSGGAGFGCGVAPIEVVAIAGGVWERDMNIGALAATIAASASPRQYTG